MIAATHALAIPGFAQTGSEALLGASDGIYSYVPFIQGLCYVIAALIAIVGAASIYMAMQTSPQQVSKRIVTSVGSCLCFVCMAISLPQFFGYESYCGQRLRHRYERRRRSVQWLPYHRQGWYFPKWHQHNHPTVVRQDGQLDNLPSRLEYGHRQQPYGHL